MGDKDVLTRGRPSVALDLKRPEAVAAVLDLVESADVLVEGMRPGAIERLGLGPEACHARNPTPGLRPDDRVGPGRAVEPGRRPRHELHRHHRRPPRPRPGPRPAALPGQPAGRLRRRVDVPRHRRPRRPPRGEDQRSGAGRRRRDRRRDRPPQRDGLDLRRARPGHRPQALGPARRRHSLLRRLRDGRRQAHECRRAGAAVLRRPRRAPGDRASRPQRPGQLPCDPRSAHRALQGADPGRVVGGLRRHRRLRGRDHPAQRGARPPAPRCPRHLRRGPRRRPAGPGAAVLAYGLVHHDAAAPVPAPTPATALDAWGVDADALIASGAATQA